MDLSEHYVQATEWNLVDLEMSFANGDRHLLHRKLELCARMLLVCLEYWDSIVAAASFKQGNYKRVDWLIREMVNLRVEGHSQVALLTTTRAVEGWVTTEAIPPVFPA